LANLPVCVCSPLSAMPIFETTCADYGKPSGTP
jgi:hypothetical protein